MQKDTPINQRKDDHIRINLNQDVQSGRSTGLEKYHFIHQALPEMSLEEVQLSQTIFGKTQRVPFYVSSMTGGTRKAEQINRNLATAAQKMGFAMGVGSQRAAIINPDLASSFQVRKYAPDILLFANLGAVQLNLGYGVDECRRAVEMIEANALILHLNPLQEALQPEGDTDFSGLVKKIRKVREKLAVPVIVKEVGWGLSQKASQMLFDAGVDAVDVAGAGGTSWSQVEMYRIKDTYRRQTANFFKDWGIPTAESIRNARLVNKEWIVFASGGLKNGMDAAKCLALGANLSGMAGILLKAANDSFETTVNVMRMLVEQLRITMFATGTRKLADLTSEKLVKED